MAEAYPWQDSLWQQLAGRAQHAHAYLLHGPIGIGKRALAERLMASLLCQRPVNLEACGECKSCLLLKAGSHPDNYLLEPEEADKAIKVDQVRDLVSFVVQTAQMGGRKVVLIGPRPGRQVNRGMQAMLHAMNDDGSVTGVHVEQSFDAKNTFAVAS